jgi:hypothetical protein
MDESDGNQQEHITLFSDDTYPLDITMAASPRSGVA